MKHIKISLFIVFFSLMLIACEEVTQSVTIQFDTQGGNIISDVVLDVGCGKGAFSRFVNSAGGKFIGLEFSKNAKVIAEKEGIIRSSKG